LSGHLVADGLVNSVYNNDGRLAVTRTGKTTVFQFHNGFGQRVAKVSVPGDHSTTFEVVPLDYATNIYYVYDDGGRLLGEYDARSRPLQETLYLGDTPVVVLRKSTQAGEHERTEVFQIYADHLNTPRVITRATDNRIVWRWDSSDPFGLLPPDEDPTAIGQFTYNLRFPGQIYDIETNLHYNYFRDYDPRTGRYLQSDPIGLSGGINTYAYVLNNPISFTDPLGLDVNVCFYGDAAMGFGHVGFGLPGEIGTQGFYPTGNPFNSLGNIKHDAQKEQQCKVIESSPEQDQCMLRCRARREAIPGNYGLTTRQCTSFVRDCLRECGLPAGNYAGPRPSPFFQSLQGKQ
jgi:RHS repeat-associated protein